MSQESILPEKVRMYTEAPSKLPPLRSNSTKPYQRVLTNSIGDNNNYNQKSDSDHKIDLSANKEGGAHNFSNFETSHNDSTQDLGVLLEQHRLQNKLNDQEIQSIANRIQFIQNQQMNVWKKTNDLYEKAVYMYENKKRYQIESKMKEAVKQSKQKEIEVLQTRKEQQKEQARQKIQQNQEQIFQDKKKQAQDIKDQSRELTQMRDYFISTFQRQKKTRHEQAKQTLVQAQVKIQNFYDEKQRVFKEQYNQKIMSELQVQEQKHHQIKNLEDVEKSLLDQFKRTKIQCDQLVDQIDEAQGLKPEEIESKYPIFASVAYSNMVADNKFDIQGQQNMNSIVFRHKNSGQKGDYYMSQNLISPVKKNQQQQNRYRQHSQYKVNPLQNLHQDKQNLMNRTYNSNSYQVSFGGMNSQKTSKQNSQYKSIQPRVYNSIHSRDENFNSDKITLSNTRYEHIYRSSNSKPQKNTTKLNFSAIYENESVSNKDSSSIANKESKQLDSNNNHDDNLEYNQYTFEIKDQIAEKQHPSEQALQMSSKNKTKRNTYMDSNELLNNSNEKTSSSPDKNNSTKVSLSNKGQSTKSPIKERPVLAQKASQTKIDLSMYHPRNSNAKKQSIDNNNSYMIATEGDQHLPQYKRNKFNHFDIMLNRDDVNKQRKLLLSQQKQTRSKSLITPNKLDISNSPYQGNSNNNNNVNIKF